MSGAKTVAFKCEKACTLHYTSNTYVYNECTRYPKLTYKCFACGSTYTSGEISSSEPDVNITGPFNAEIIITGNNTQTSLPVNLSAKVTHKASDNPIQISSCKYVIIQDSLPLGTDTASYTGGTFSSNGQTINIRANKVGDWYLHVLSVDSTGIKKETIKGPIKVTAKTHVHTGSSSSGGGCYTNHQYSQGTWQGTRGSWSPGQSVNPSMKCPRCGSNINTWDAGGGYTCWGCSNGNCGSYVGGYNYWTVGCGKNETTIEGYNVSF